MSRDQVSMCYASSVKGSATQAITYICPAEALPRISQITKYKDIQHKNILPLISSGIVTNPKDQQEYFAFSYGYKAFEPVLESWTSPVKRIAPDAMLTTYLPLLLEALDGFHKNDFVHGAINLRNLFFVKSDKGDDELYLGECLSVAPSVENAFLYEPVNRATATPNGRGLGGYGDDLYSLGVCVAMMIWGYNPMSSMTEEDIHFAKITRGTYDLLTSQAKIKVSSRITDFLKGVLNDDERERWTPQNVKDWLGGTKTTPKQASVARKAARPFEHKKQAMSYIPEAIYHFSNLPVEEAESTLNNAAFLNWITRNYKSKNVLVNISKVYENVKTEAKTGPYKERFLTELFMALDATGPIRYKEFSFCIRAFGAVLAYQYARKRDVKDLAEVLKFQLYGFWLAMQHVMPSDTSEISSTYGTAKQSITSSLIGMGIERAMYTGCRDAPCLSPAFSKSFVATSGDVVRVLNKHAGQGRVSAPVFDRHIAAFLSVRDSRVIDSHMGGINSRDKAEQLVAALKTCALIKVKENIQDTVALCDYFIDKSDSVLSSIKNNKYKEIAKKQKSKLKGTGDLVSLARLLADDKKRNADVKEFIQAKTEYKRLETQKDKIAGSIEKKKERGRERGRQVAFLFGIILGFLGILLNVMVFLG